MEHPLAQMMNGRGMGGGGLRWGGGGGDMNPVVVNRVTKYCCSLP